MSTFDVVVIGCGPAGERAAILAARAGKRVAVVERANVVGGARINWGTIPSKTLRESALFVRHLTRRMQEGFACSIQDSISINDFMHRERTVVQRELELINKVLDRYRIEVFQGHARFVDPHTVSVEGTGGQSRLQLRGEVFVIATGSSPNHPPDVPFDGEVVFDSDTLLTIPRMPRSLVVLGAGVIGVEYASIFAALGREVTLVNSGREQLLPYMDHEIAELLERELRQLGVNIIHGDRYRSIERVERVEGQPPRVRCETRQGNLLEGDALLYTVGRDGNSGDLGLQAIGVEPNHRGLLAVNEYLQTSLPHIYAAGDVIGYPALASTSMEQGRRAIRHAFNLSGPMGDSHLLPFAIYSIPEVSYVGQAEHDLRESGVDVVVGRGLFAKNPRGQVMGERGGALKLIFDAQSTELLGAHIVGPGASELIHIGQALLLSHSTAEQIAEMLFNYPTLSDLYLHAALEALQALRQRPASVT
jgi:NAD(P) transhydrogenase